MMDHKPELRDQKVDECESESPSNLSQSESHERKKRFFLLQPRKNGFSRGPDHDALIAEIDAASKESLKKPPTESEHDRPGSEALVHTSSFRHEAVRLGDITKNEAESQDHVNVESSDSALYSRNDPCDHQDDCASQTPVYLSDADETKITRRQSTAEPESSQSDGGVTEDSDLQTQNLAVMRTLQRKVAVAPLNDSSSELTSSEMKIFMDRSWSSESEQAGEDGLQSPQVELSHKRYDSAEKKKGFQLLALRKAKKAEAESTEMSTEIVTMTEANDVVEDVVEPTTVPSDAKVRNVIEPSTSNTKPRKGKISFGRKKNKIGNLDEEVVLDSLGNQEGHKGLALRLPRGSKGARAELEASSTQADSATPKKEKVRARIKQRLKKGGGKGTPKGIERESSWDWENSDSEELVESMAMPQIDDVDESQPDVFDEGDLSNFELLAPPPVKDAVPLRARVRSRDKKFLRVKPYYCFSPQKVYMSEDEIYQNMLQPSEIVEHVESFIEPWYNVEQETTEMERTVWGDASDGRIGSLRVEVLGCVGLSKHKSDAVVYLVCGDAAFATDVIPSSRSPMWPACSKRAACFPVFHAYARLCIGVFDVVAKKYSENDSFCGRASLDISTLRPDTEYDVTLSLRGSSFVYARRPQGVVRLRFSLHWFSERAAVLSYLKPPRNQASTYQLVGQPSIPCADPKSFRNVAVTIHGPELPGKYSRKAFQATMREFSLYWQNCKFLAKSSIRSAILYEQPLKSLYIFFGWMHCTLHSSVRHVPAYVVGFMIILMLEGYMQYAANPDRYHGYMPVSIQEMLLALLQNKKSKSRQIQPLLREKKVRSEQYKNEESECDPCDHMEFPFSDRFEYKRRVIEECLVRRATNARKEKLEELELQGRLSIYVKQQGSFGSGKSAENEGDETTMVSSVAAGQEIDDLDKDFDSDPELDVHGDMDNVFEFDVDEDEEEQPAADRRALNSATSMKKSIVVGPPQDTDMKPIKKVPPQLHLARLEDRLNKLTQSLSMDKVFSTTLAYRPQCQEDEQFRSVLGEHPQEGKKRGKRIPLDDFDKRLGYRIRHPNPVTEITSSYLGPLMRIFRILCTIVRVVFNIGVWSDPYLSFWVLLFLIALLLILIAFPWRLFSFIVGIVGFGPQNFLVGRRLARNASENAEQVDQPKQVETRPKQADAIPEELPEAMSKKGAAKRSAHMNPIAKLKERRQKRLAEKQEVKEWNGSFGSSFAELERSQNNLDKRPAFSAGTAAKATRKQVDPREIVVPYSRLRTERFYDWPPDPTGSRATPFAIEKMTF